MTDCYLITQIKMYDGRFTMCQVDKDKKVLYFQEFFKTYCELKCGSI
jgi:hypothetical protein